MPKIDPGKNKATFTMMPPLTPTGSVVPPSKTREINSGAAEPVCLKIPFAPLDKDALKLTLPSLAMDTPLNGVGKVGKVDMTIAGPSQGAGAGRMENKLPLVPGAGSQL
jgi:hypothetical protein